MSKELVRELLDIREKIDKVLSNHYKEVHEICNEPSCDRCHGPLGKNYSTAVGINICHACNEKKSTVSLSEVISKIEGGN